MSIEASGLNSVAAPANGGDADFAKKMQEQMKQVMKDYDKDGSGNLDQSEVGAAIKDGAIKTGKKAESLIARFDKNGDDRLNEAELGEALNPENKKAEEKIEKSRKITEAADDGVVTEEEELEILDENGDGEISADEEQQVSFDAVWLISDALRDIASSE